MNIFLFVHRSRVLLYHPIARNVGQCFIRCFDLEWVGVPQMYPDVGKGVIRVGSCG
jgi:hypothetical protein